MNIALNQIKNLILKRKYLSTNPLGRWSIDKNKLETNTTVDWANHDHCGSESCRLSAVQEDKQNIKISIDEKNLIENESIVSLHKNNK